MLTHSKPVLAIFKHIPNPYSEPYILPIMVDWFYLPFTQCSLIAAMKMLPKVFIRTIEGE